jgi:hypothetical protein
MKFSFQMGTRNTAKRRLGFCVSYVLRMQVTMESVFQRLVTYHETLQNIHPLEDGSGQARLPESSTPG